ncbi:interleukin-1 beta-like [Poeciliopsis prolifica]|uniref:interleukin-1 beta-like n=1 Tax=Poeciliopsis prolifica TaxID=188132 RepID=UPI0024132F01|nr:interleukin-1 beta-like [Poeciliopsis prolifica]
MESKKNCSVSQMCTKEMPKGADLEISHQAPSMRRVVNLIIAMERLKVGMAKSVLSPNLSNKERLIFERTSAEPSQFFKREEHPCSVTDGPKRSLVLVRNSMNLLAVTLTGGNDIFLNMANYIHLFPDTGLGQPVVLGIRDTNLYLCCKQVGDTPILHVVEVGNKMSLSTITAGSDMMRFLFYKQDTSLNVSTLMSAF